MSQEQEEQFNALQDHDRKRLVKKDRFELFANSVVSPGSFLPAVKRHGHREGGILLLLLVVGTFSFSSFS